MSAEVNRDTTPANKYTDAQVSSNLDLFASIAYEYVRNYGGTFDLLCDYRDRVAQGGSLTVPMIRATLNCMRYDARVRNLPAPTFEVRDYGAVTPTPQRTGRVRWLRAAPEPVVPEPRPAKVKMPVKWKMDYGAYAESTSSNLIHRVDPRSYLLWDTETRTPEFRMWWRCKTAFKGMGKTRITLMDSLEAAIHIMQSHGYVKPCRRCADWAPAPARGVDVDIEWRKVDLEGYWEDVQSVLVDQGRTLDLDGEVGNPDVHAVHEGDSPA